MLQLIFVVETDKKCDSDTRYINYLVKTRYNITSDIKLNFIRLNGKSNYCKKNIILEINKLIKSNNLGKNNVDYVIYCFDTDDINNKQQARIEFNKELLFCKKNNYHLIWFNKDIEFVLLGKSIENNIKKKMSQEFVRNNNLYTKILFKDDNDYNQTGSNIYNLLDKILEINN